eukprot:60717_1
MENVNLEELIKKSYHCDCIVDTIPINQRVHYLVFGYVRQFEKQWLRICPMDIKDMCRSYVEMHINTELEMHLEEHEKVKRITMLGAGAVGKTSLVTRVITDQFCRDYEPRIEDTCLCTLEVDGIQTDLDIMDTFGQEQFAALRHHWIRESNAFMLVYSVNSERTFRHIDDLIKSIMRIKDEEFDNVSMILVGNKKDLPLNQHEVSFEMGKIMAHKWDMSFIETSAKTGCNVNEAYKMLVRQTRKRLLRRIELIQQENMAQNNSCCNIL